MEITQDDLNVIELVDLQIAMQAIENKIIVKVDKYKSGYECKVCNATGKIKSTIVEGSMRDCDKCNGTGQTIHIPQNAQSMPSTGVIMSMGAKTEYMMTKSRLKGYREALKLNPKDETYKELVEITEEELKLCMLQIGTRVVFGQHTGTKIPLRGEIKLTIMTEKEPLCVLFGTNIEDRAILDYTVENV